MCVNEWVTELVWKIHATFLCPITIILPPPTVGDWEGTGGGGTNSTVTTPPSSVLSLS